MKLFWLSFSPAILSVILFVINQILGLNKFIFSQLKENGIEIHVKEFGFRLEFIKMIVEYNRLLKRKKDVSKKERFICRWVTFEIIFGYVSFIYFLVFVFIVFRNY
ncbi:MAG: hypothetical protein A2W93_05980 [Bacteroidetes bacterium GWF2_43_63]|nr:MAG: hypothetical protein A2W94_04475 [Bacteroidetes bacterium GWE2_42_42]OFY55967.1 MAG: hypothetical protein A2W93_05980 [Bacteroidetes bacterium GWF2_43_63]HBG71532.1 hypothetical protein [Bacteroidales bacterium]HCB63004.1 hypothetical protein [Bacteroidales bacterium]HCY22293.1 hypothetical protein [Bacteroidales bacterium]